ncbi:hypothetical protein B0J13DRAFT_541314 [Dactylonectria estremocensis]|uniref:Ubiquitin 3 binding protein But2 C-terminal domain-containing protein n=1 Tax=Dactylonectria estremocensis TaxID=1079267 RepID=A0A9P9FEQ1_9HYPO|nr:hypothetical protein B0J13DRAFT_541314 [Dactylonectria estremocensis]
MLLHTFISAAIAVTSVLAAPIESRANFPGFFTPVKTWQYSVKTGAIAATSGSVNVYKSPSNKGDDKTALLTVKYSSVSEGMQCQFKFYLAPGSNPTGSRQLDLFTSNSPAPGPTNGWGPGNQRNIHLGRFSVAPGESSSWISKDHPYLTKKTPCKKPGTVEAFELVGVNDFDSINWDPTSPWGPRIVWSP